MDVRLIAASNQPLDELVKAGDFRQDLYYRLNVYPVNLPPLRERHDDIIPLAETFLLKYAGELNQPAQTFSEQAINRLLAYAWPGNVRELENVIQRAVVLASDKTISAEHLPDDFRNTSIVSDGIYGFIPPNATLAEMEHYWIRRVLENCGGNKTEAARQLGINASTLHRKLKD